MAVEVVVVGRTVVDCVVVVAPTNDVVTDELDVLPPLIVLSLHETSSVAKTIAAPAITLRTFIREVCQRHCRSADQSVGFLASFN